MRFVRVTAWIDRGYDGGVARSNYLLGVLLSFLGLTALFVEVELVRFLVLGVAVAVFAFFGWRMILSFKRQAAAADCRKRPHD